METFPGPATSSQESEIEKNLRQSTENIEKITSVAVKSALQELLKYGLLEADRKPRLYQIALIQSGVLNQLLEPLDLCLRVDDIRGLAFLVVSEQGQKQNSEEDDWVHPLVRRQRLTLEQSLLVAILRQYYVIHEQDVGIGAGNAIVTLDDLLPQLQVYLGDSGSDSKNQKRLRVLLENLKTHGIISDIDDKEQVTIRPIITHLANPETLQALLGQFRQIAAVNSEASGEEQ
ncbi:MAG: DUF4194 domain-containing protein [Rouxiella aceris]|uniref:DUF4194 domain-containing protein n=1 Tax=Rouxiella aceris TaxID=2703884 RepID=UPI00283E1C17|nr:DUF4194 domain-containing protein [Rouxiella aceris]MDR3432088.1 DUF4194 domain-containing protein [Rouxiella aceris]